jgi:UDP-2-acetamido-2-deoxy-ribo-hexuluronate aminotransferase
MSNIRLFQTDRAWQQIGAEVLDLTNSAHLKGQAQNGDLTRELEAVLAKKFNRRHCITVASGTDALQIALQALNLPKNSPVAVNNYTFTASAHAIARAGYSVVPVDTDKNYCIDVDQISNCSAVVPVDLFGNMTDYDRLERLGVPFVVDAAQSMESFNGRWSVEYGTAACISFSPSKPISSWGSGGAILTDDDVVDMLARRLRLHGKQGNNIGAVAPGLNSMMSSMEVASVLVGLKYAKEWRQRRQQIALHLIGESRYETANDTDLMQHTYSKLVFQTGERGLVQAQFKAAGIDCPVHYNLLIADEWLYPGTQSLTLSKYLRDRSFTVPNQHTLTDSEVEQIAKVLK